MADFVRGSLAFEGTLCLEFCMAREVRYSRLVRYLSDIADTSLSLQKVSHEEQRKKERKLRDISRMTSRKYSVTASLAMHARQLPSAPAAKAE